MPCHSRAFLRSGVSRSDPRCSWFRRLIGSPYPVRAVLGVPVRVEALRVDFDPVDARV
jgi:hypothetical protein